MSVQPVGLVAMEITNSDELAGALLILAIMVQTVGYHFIGPGTLFSLTVWAAGALVGFVVGAGAAVFMIFHMTESNETFF